MPKSIDNVIADSTALPVSAVNPTSSALMENTKTLIERITSQIRLLDGDSGSQTLTSVDRATADLRRGLPVFIVGSDGQSYLAHAAEAVDNGRLERLISSTPRSSEPVLILTGPRSHAVGLSDGSHATYIVTSESGLDESIVGYLSDPCSDFPAPPDNSKLKVEPGDRLAKASVKLTKIARLIPAVVAVKATPLPGFLSVSVDDIEAYDDTAGASLRLVSQARVPLEDAENARIVAFRPRDGGVEHLAIVIGEPDLSQPVLIRLHSECFTGDLLGSLRCDCGSQLRGAIAEIAQTGSGILLYLAQEGRGIGLINKLRAYQLQDAGLDTVEANLHIGFDMDERVYLPAAQMLKLLGIRRVKLMTNNPLKMSALERFGIEMTERVPHIFPSNLHNQGYLKTKAAKSGHLL